MAPCTNPIWGVVLAPGPPRPPVSQSKDPRAPKVPPPRSLVFKFVFPRNRLGNTSLCPTCLLAPPIRFFSRLAQILGNQLRFRPKTAFRSRDAEPSTLFYPKSGKRGFHVCCPVGGFSALRVFEYAKRLPFCEGTLPPTPGAPVLVFGPLTPVFGFPDTPRVATIDLTTSGGLRRFPQLSLQRVGARTPALVAKKPGYKFPESDPNH